jgi:predicted nucleotidyltransferase
MLTENDVARIAGRVARKFAPLAVGTFGSYAIGTAHEQSDLALFVIRDPADPSTPDGVAVRWFLASVMHPLDIHVFTPAEFEAAAREDLSFASNIVRQARHYHWTEYAKKDIPSLFARPVYSDFGSISF